MNDIHIDDPAATKAREVRVRREGRRQGLVVIKVREGSRWFQEYGPYMLGDIRTRGTVASGLDLDSLEEHLGETTIFA